jgi:hypothetical protein
VESHIPYRPKRLGSYVFRQLILVGGFLIGNWYQTIPHNKIEDSSTFLEVTRVGTEPIADQEVLQVETPAVHD